MREIITEIEKLNEPSSPLEFLDGEVEHREEGQAIISELKEILLANKDLLALSAPQIGINKRIICIKFNDIIKTFINPILTKKKGMVIAPETFIGMPGKEILIGRPEEISLVYYTDEFKYEDNKLLGLAARLFDQQYQLLDGLTPADIGLVSDIEQDGSIANLTDEEFQELAEFYKKYIAVKSKAVQESVNSDEETAKSYKSLKFTEDVINGRTLVVDEADTAVVAQRNRTMNFHTNRMKKQAHQTELNNFAKKYRK